jgi:hypothetical protein
MMRTTRGCLFVIVISVFVFQSCYRKDIGFGNLPDNNYTNVAFTDTVQPVLSTVVLDSFATNNPTSFLVGKYKDPYLGVISTKPFFQMTIPAATVTIPASAKYDSFCFIMHPNKYYYGDTARSQTIYINELADYIYYTYNTSIYNTSNFAVKPVPLGSKTLKIRPNGDDSIQIKLDDAKGLELFNNLANQASEIQTDANFQNYFKGISLSVANADTAAVYGLSATSTNMVMRVYYHTTTPYNQSLSVDFPLKSGFFSFNQILTDRTGTPLYSPSPVGVKEFFSTQTNNESFTQFGTGVLLKAIFPSLKSIVTTDKIIELQKAELVFRPIGSSFDFNKYVLPNSLSLAATDATNSIGGNVATNVTPVIDEIYGTGTYYKFDVTSYINMLLTTTGNSDKGLFLLQNGVSPNVTRAVMGDSNQPLFNVQLLVTAIIINK